MNSKDVQFEATDAHLREIIISKKDELVRLVNSKKQLTDSEVVKKSAELDQLLVKYMRTKLPSS